MNDWSTLAHALRQLHSALLAPYMREHGISGEIGPVRGR
jgi:hypothetical protein